MQTINVSEETKKKFNDAHVKYQASIGSKVSADKLMTILLEVYEHEERSY